jgi:hypothetical protein
VLAFLFVCIHGLDWRRLDFNISQNPLAVNAFIVSCFLAESDFISFYFIHTYKKHHRITDSVFFELLHCKIHTYVQETSSMAAR